MRTLLFSALASVYGLHANLARAAEPVAESDQHVAVTLPGAPGNGIIIQKNVMVRMRDGVHLATDIYRPAGTARYPVVLCRTPYGSETAVYVNRAEYFVKHGYVFAVQDVRGKNDSEGDWWGKRNDAEDGSDTITWLGTQPWSSGKVGMTGASYGGIVQYLVMDQENSHLTALAPQVAAATLGRDASDYEHLAVYGGREDGIPGGNFFWMVGTDGRVNQADSNSPVYDTAWDHLPRSDYPKIFGRRMDWLPFVMNHQKGFSEELFLRAARGEWSKPLDDAEWWSKSSYIARYRKVSVPILHISGWFDSAGESMIKNFESIRDYAQPSARNTQQLLLGPWSHSWGAKNSDFDFGPESALDQDETIVNWYDRWLKDDGQSLPKLPAVRVFVMGENHWREADDWPIPGTRFTQFYLHSKGSAHLASAGGELSVRAPGREPVDRYTYDPGDPTPVPSQALSGPADMVPTEKRNDVLVYTTEVLKAPVEVTGPLSAVLYVSTSAPSTDFTVRLLDVYPNGTAYNLNAPHPPFRTHWAKESEQAADGTHIIKCEIMLYPTANQFLAGHRIRVEIASSWVVAATTFQVQLPKFGSRGLNVAPGTELSATHWNVAQQRIYHDRTHASYVLLPVIPR